MIQGDFWKRYVEADELERHKILDELKIEKDKNGFYKHFTTTLFQSYLDDLIETLISRQS